MEVVYTEQLPRVYNYFRYRVGDGPLAKDLTAMTFEKAWRGRMRYQRNRAAFSTWLFTIARNLASDHFRHSRLELPLEALDQRVNPVSVEEIVQRKQEFSRLTVLLAELPVRERELIAFKFGAGLTNREIANLTQLSESNVGTILNRTVQKLRANWKVDDAR